MIGLFSLTILAVAYRAGDTLSRQSVVLYTGLFCALTGFAVIVDMIHATLAGRAASVAAVAEEGGELVVLSLVLGLAIAVHRRVRQATGRLAS